MNDDVMSKIQLEHLKSNIKKDVLEEVLRRYNSLDHSAYKYKYDTAWLRGHNEGASDLLHIIYEMLDADNEDFMTEVYKIAELEKPTDP